MLVFYFLRKKSSLKDQLLAKNPATRLASGLQSHPFFDGLDWAAVLARQVAPSEALQQDVSMFTLTEETFTQSFLALSSVQSLDCSKATNNVELH